MSDLENLPESAHTTQPDEDTAANAESAGSNEKDVTVEPASTEAPAQEDLLSSPEKDSLGSQTDLGVEPAAAESGRSPEKYPGVEAVSAETAGSPEDDVRVELPDPAENPGMEPASGESFKSSVKDTNPCNSADAPAASSATIAAGDAPDVDVDTNPCNSAEALAASSATTVEGDAPDADAATASAGSKGPVVPALKISRDVDAAPADAGNRAPSIASLSPRPAMASPRTRIKRGSTEYAIQAHLFGGSAGSGSGGGGSPRAKPKSKKFITKEDVERIARPRGPPKEIVKDANCTFKPAIDENSRKMLQNSSAGENAEPRVQTLALSKTPEQKQRLQTAKQRQDEAEMAPCTFKPSTNWHDPKKVSGDWSKSTSRYIEHIPERYVKAKEDLANRRKEAEAEINRPREPAKKPTKNSAQSPRSAVTTPVPFQSRTALRKQQREQSQVELVADFDDPVFADLHRMLHSLQLNGTWQVAGTNSTPETK